MKLIHLTDALITAIAGLIPPSTSGAFRKPSHIDLDDAFRRHGLTELDPKNSPHQLEKIGKQRRVSAVLQCAKDKCPEKGGAFAVQFVGQLRGWGVFNQKSDNYVGPQAISNAENAFHEVGLILTSEGGLLQINLDSLSGSELTDALKIYAHRAIRGDQDAALIAGTSKDLVEATVKHFLEMRGVEFKEKAPFPMLVMLVFLHLQQSDIAMSDGGYYCDMLNKITTMAEGVNNLRNKEGTGHGRTTPPKLTLQQAKTVARFSGAISAFLLDFLDDNRAKNGN